MPQETERFYRDLVTRHLNLILKWQTLNTPEGREKLIEHLCVLQASITVLIDQYIANTESNIQTFYTDLALNQQYVDRLKQRVLEINESKLLWEQTLTQEEKDKDIVPSKALSSKNKTIEITIVEEEPDERSLEVPSLLHISDENK